MNHKKGKHKKGRHKHDVISHVMSLLNWWTLGQGRFDFVVGHQRDRILTTTGGIGGVMGPWDMRHHLTS